MDKKLWVIVLVAFIILYITPVCSSNNSISGSVITKTLKEMLDSYYTELAYLREEVKELEEGRDYIIWMLNDIEDSLRNVEFYYFEKEYKRMNEELKKIDEEIVKAKREMVLLKMVSERKEKIYGYDIWLLPVYIILIVGVYLFVKIFILGKQRLKVGKVDLTLIDKQVKRDIQKDNIPLIKRIEKIEKEVKDIGNKRWLIEIELIKNKYNQGLLGMCEDYLNTLEKEMKLRKKKGV